MKRALFIAASLVCFGLLSPAWAEFQDGLQAYYRLDFRAALREWQPLAEQGNPEASYQLGILYYRGEGVQQDYAEAARWFEQAAGDGDADAQYNMGLMHANGQGVAKDLVRAHMWFTLAAAGYAKGAGRDWAIRDPDWAVRNRNWSAAQLTPEEIAEAWRLIQDWRANHQTAGR
jgi:TPR repeat protein